MENQLKEQFKKMPTKTLKLWIKTTEGLKNFDPARKVAEDVYAERHGIVIIRAAQHQEKIMFMTKTEKEFIIITKDGRTQKIWATSPRLAESVFLGANHKYTLGDIKLTYCIDNRT